MALINVSIALQTNKELHFRKIEGETSETNGLVVTPAWIRPRERPMHDNQEFDKTECQIIHKPSGHLVATFRMSRQAMAAARELGTLGIRWSHDADDVEREVKAKGARPQIREILEKYQYLESIKGIESNA